MSPTKTVVKNRVAAPDLRIARELSEYVVTNELVYWFVPIHRMGD